MSIFTADRMDRAHTSHSENCSYDTGLATSVNGSPILLVLEKWLLFFLYFV